MRSRSHVTSRRLAAVAALMALVVPMSSCGTRMSSEEIAAADGSAIAGRAPTAGGTVPVDGVGAVPPLGSAGSPGTAATAVPPSGSAGATTGNPAAGGAADARDPNATRGGTGPAASVGGKAGGAGAPCAQMLAPVVIGQTSPSSGIIGASTFNIRAGLALWARAVNAAGGVQCHPVQLYQMDDAADPARVTSNLTELVNNKKAVAIVGAGVPTTFAAALRFAEQNKVPFVGGDLIEPTWFSSPYFFPQGGSPLASYAGALKEAAAKAGTKKVGLVYCVESGSCGTVNDNFEAMAKASGLDVVLRKVSSITSPDYTAECQALKSAGAGAVFIALEGSGTSRFARSCLSLGYAPPAATSALAVSAEAAQDPNIRKLGLFLGSGTVPYPAGDTAGGKAFQAAYDRFASGSPIDQNLISQWVSGTLFEAAIAKVFEQARNGPITREMLFEGLWQIKKEKLDGLAPALTFNRQAPPASSDCYSVLYLVASGFTAPQGGKFNCFTGLPRGF